MSGKLATNTQPLYVEPNARTIQGWAIIDISTGEAVNLTDCTARLQIRTAPSTTAPLLFTADSTTEEDPALVIDADAGTITLTISQAQGIALAAAYVGSTYGDAYLIWGDESGPDKFWSAPVNLNYGTTLPAS